MTPAAFIDNPAWADIFPEFKDGGSSRHLPTHEDSSRIDPEKAAGHLMIGGTLGSMRGYEERPGQLDMLKSVAEAYNAREHLMIEAGTGVGKSLAYLIPSVLWAWTNDTPVIVSTATRNLQSQLISSDIPRAVSVLGDEASKFKTALLKGRSNYLCLRALGDFFAPGFWTMTKEEQDEMPRFIEWLKSTKDGDLDTYDGLPRSLISCPGEECSARRCPYYSRCFVFRARKAAAKAHLVVVNHALVLAEATSGAGSILPAYSRLVLDEAHNLESIATDYLSREFSIEALTRIFNRLIRKGRGKRASASGALASLERQLQRGAVSDASAASAVVRLAGEISSATVQSLNALEDVIDYSIHLFKPIKNAETLRYKMLDGVRMYCVRGLFREYSKDDWDEDLFFALQTKLESALAYTVKTLHELRDTLERSVPEGEVNTLSDIAVQFDTIAESLVAFANDANFILSAEESTHAYWIERVHREKRKTSVRLVAAPLSVADDLHNLLYDPKDSVVLTSATLRVGNDFKYMSRRLGCKERFRALTALSPFDYLKQSRVLAPDCLPDPSADPAGYSEKLALLLKDLFSATKGRALVLFTSYEMMNSVASFSREIFAREGIELLVQGEGLSRESMTSRLKDSPDGSRTVLFGSQSFWEGVDVSGEALSCVVIARLPFAQVGDPVVEARAEKIDREGGSSFRDYALPEAVIKFRQGFGRLIRSKRDSGVVVVTDPRLVTKNYGAVFRKSIPASVHTVVDLNELIDRVVEFFEGREI